MNSIYSEEESAAMEAQWIADRAALRCLSRQHPQWTQQELATCLGRSISWIRKWLKRLRQATPEDLAILHSRSRARRTPPPPPDSRLVEKIAQIREHPPKNLKRIPGPRAILFYLQQDTSETSHIHPPSALHAYRVENPAPPGLHPGRTGAQTQAVGAA